MIKWKCLICGDVFESKDISSAKYEMSIHFETYHFDDEFEIINNGDEE